MGTGRRWPKGTVKPAPQKGLTHRLQRGGPEEFVELGKVHDHAELVGLLGRRHLLARGHRGDAKLTLGHVKC